MIHTTAPSERSLVLGATRQLAVDLFAAGKCWEGCKAMLALGMLLDRKELRREDVCAIRDLAKELAA